MCFILVCGMTSNVSWWQGQHSAKMMPFGSAFMHHFKLTHFDVAMEGVRNHGQWSLEEAKLGKHAVLYTNELRYGDRP